MKMIKTPLFAFLLLCFSTALKAQYIQVNDNFTAQQLVENVLINSSCASVSNFSVLGGDFNGEQSYGYFDGAGTTFPFANGVVLSTGRAISTQGPNNSLLDDGAGMNWPGDTQLEQALEINNSVNATILEFDFVPLGNKISFDYILSSEEYHDNAPCRYSDGFAFLLTEVGSGLPFKNLAVVPNTTIPVKVTSVRPQIGGNGGCEAQNEQYFGGFNDYEHPTNFNGQTTRMTAQSDVTPGVLYHIKLVIADEGNYRYDSAIFLEGGSFRVETDLGQSRLVATENPLCEGEIVTLNATNPNAISYKWFKDSILEPTETTANYVVSEPGTYTVEVELAGSCFSTGEIEIEYTAKPILSNATLVQCDDDNDGLTFFNLNQANNQIVADNSNLSAPTFFLTQANAENDTAPINNTTAFENIQNVIYARVENQFGCYGIATVTLAVSNNNITNPANLETCDEDSNPSDGISTFDLEETEDEILANLPGGNVGYFTSYADALSGLNPILTPSNFQNTVAFQQTIFAKLSSGVDCYGIASFDIIVNSFQGSFDDVERDICSGNSIQLNAGSGFSSYSWNTNPVQTSQIITISNPGTYIVTVSNAFGCTTTKKFIVSASSIAQVSSVSVNDFQGGLNSATINLTSTSIGDYEYSLDGAVYQNSPTFIGLNPGQYTVYINDKNECGQISYDFYVMDYPKFFTPNQDGVNDIWRIPFLQFQPKATVAIYDRYGKLLHFFTGSQPGWDGTFKGKNVFANDYWFVITLENGREVKGHFSLVR